MLASTKHLHVSRTPHVSRTSHTPGGAEPAIEYRRHRPRDDRHSTGVSTGQALQHVRLVANAPRRLPLGSQMYITLASATSNPDNIAAAVGVVGVLTSCRCGVGTEARRSCHDVMLR